MEIDLRAWLIVSQTPGVGAVTFHRLLKRFGSPKLILKAPFKELRDVGLNEKAIHFLKNPPSDKITPNLTWADAPDHVIRTFHCRQYPQKIKEIQNAPPLLYIKGNEKLLSEPQIAVIGSRKPTPGGQVNAKNFSRDLAKAGILVTSGMALGIDTIAHDAALTAGGGTVAVIATGSDKIYPAKNKPLAERIAKQGVLVSEFPVGIEPIRANFPRRNRLISALSLGVLVIEADRQSGALITAQWAAEQGKDVFAIPGSIHNPRAQGCHYLIKQGAKLVEKIEDILLELQLQLKPYLYKDKDENDGELKRQSNLKATHWKILEAMGHEAVDIDTLATQCELPVQTVAVALITLEMENYVGEDNGIYTRIRYS